MANVSLSNSVSVTGTYSSEVLTLKSNVVVTEIVNGLVVRKEVDKQRWIDGELKYTITVENNSDKSFEAPILVDVLDPNIIKLVEKSVQIDNVDSNYNYEESTGTLTINLGTITVGNTSVITFRVQQK